MIAVRAMTPADLALGMRLKAQAGWNQTEADWRRILALAPDGCYVAELDGAVVGTAAAVRFGPVAWLCMVLVDAAVRRRGVGTALVARALDRLDAAGVRTVRLDATALGRPVYERLGFRADYDLDRWTGAARVAPPASGVRPAQASDLPVLAGLDAAAAGCGRRPLLQKLWEERPASLWVAERSRRPPGAEPSSLHAPWADPPESRAPSAEKATMLGYAACRPGVSAIQLGPIVAQTASAGLALVGAAAAAAAGGPMFVDVPRKNVAAAAWARSLGLTVQRSFTRMSRGAPASDRPDLLWASSGPEKG